MALTPTDYAAADAISLAALIRSKAVSPGEVAEAAAAAIAATNAALNFMVETRPVDAADIAGDAPFAGVPMVYKDAGAHPAGVVQGFGSRLATGLPPAGEATYLAERFQAAGLVNMGRATTAELTLAITTQTSACGITRNPWNPQLSPGGSSGGSAAAVASGAVPLAHGTDGGGSIRVPAGWTGLVGLKPSRGRISAGPQGGELMMGMAGEFVFTRSIRDCAAMLDALAGAAPGDPFTIPGPARLYAEAPGRDVASLRIGLVDPAGFGGLASRTDAALRDAVEQAGRVFAAAGAHIEPVVITLPFDAMVDAITALWCSQLAALLGPILAATRRDPNEWLDAATAACTLHGQNVSGGEVHVALTHFNAITRAIGAASRQLDLLLLPVAAEMPAPHDRFDPQAFVGDARGWIETMFAATPFTAPFNISGQPAISVPVGLSEAGLPVGVQLAASHAREDLLLRAAGVLEQALPWADRRPPIWAGSAAA